MRQVVFSLLLIGLIGAKAFAGIIPVDGFMGETPDKGPKKYQGELNPEDLPKGTSPAEEIESSSVNIEEELAKIKESQVLIENQTPDSQLQHLNDSILNVLR